MVVRREKKRKYYRGSRTYGWGRVAQHRRSGRKGGRGMVGYHKHKWTWTVKYAPDWYGKHGFTRHPSLVLVYRIMNVGKLDEVLEDLVQKGLAKIENENYVVDLTRIGINKLTGSGKVTKKIIVRTHKATRKAIEKIESLGGKVELISGE
ncbi:MAG: 50S ribosomal protein L15 [Thermoprotei archaeon]|nr:MAG: 50S ribosomal protein L15 [Thermoprotei archaeon]